MGMLSRAELERMGFASIGLGVQVSDKASFHGASRISLGNHVRIDDFCVLSAGAGGIRIGDYVHVAVYSSLIGAAVIEVGDFANVSSRVAIYSSSDDFSGSAMTNPTVSAEFTSVAQAPVYVGRHAVIGAGCVVLPGVRIGEGAAVGALSLVKRDCEEFTIYAGTPARAIGSRSRQLLELEQRFLASLRG